MLSQYTIADFLSLFLFHHTQAPSLFLLILLPSDIPDMCLYWSQSASQHLYSGLWLSRLWALILSRYLKFAYTVWILGGSNPMHYIKYSFSYYVMSIKRLGGYTNNEKWSYNHSINNKYVEFLYASFHMRHGALISQWREYTLNKRNDLS